MSRIAEFLRISLALKQLDEVKRQHPDAQIDAALEYLHERKVKVEPMKL